MHASSSRSGSGAAAPHSSLPGQRGAERATAKDLECSRRQPSRRNRTLWYARCPARARAHPSNPVVGGIGGTQSLTPAASPAQRSVHVSPVAPPSSFPVGNLTIRTYTYLPAFFFITTAILQNNMYKNVFFPRKLSIEISNFRTIWSASENFKIIIQFARF